MTKDEALYKIKGYLTDIIPVENYSEVEEIIKALQPEIIRCKDCKYWHREIYCGAEYFNFSSCNLKHDGDGNNFYCADAERRTDE